MSSRAPPDPPAAPPAPWAKRFLPRGLYGRAALILLLPVVALQLVVSLAFIQRHFEGVTRQMTSSIADEIALVVATEADDPAWAQEIGRQLGLTFTDTMPNAGTGDGRPFWDLSGRVVVQVLRDRLPALRAVSLASEREVVLRLAGRDGDFGIAFSRGQVSATNPHQLLVWMVVSGAVMTFIAYLFLRNQLRPITRLARAAEAYGRGTITPYRPGGARELRAAGAAFVEMRERIEEQNRSRALMISGVSHDLRTPLTRLRLGLTMQDDAESREMLRDVEEMEHMVAAFLDFARGGGEAPLEVSDAVALVEQVVADTRRAGREITLLPMAGQPVPVRMRPFAMRRALENLLANALRHGTRVEVGLTFAPGEWRIVVEDDGPGIAPDQRKPALQPFVRLDDSRNQDRGAGVGLGLAIVAGIAHAQGGELRLGQSGRLGGLLAEIVLPQQPRDEKGARP